ncbi:helix-turn-helix domain-containing protein [Streptomyces sp. NPDC005480]
MSDAQKRDVWLRWKEGWSLSEIGRALGKVPGSIHGVVKANGGFVPAERTRAKAVLSLAEREEISRGLARDESFRTIAARLGRSPSTVSREVGRHGGRGKYRATDADERAWESARRPTPLSEKRRAPHTPCPVRCAAHG